MDSDNPYQTPSEMAASPAPGGSAFKTVGNILLAAGLVALAYGAIAFWLIQSLPPNGGGKGRLPSIYVMGVGIAFTLIGMTVRSIRAGKKEKELTEAQAKGIRTSHGVLILVGIMILAFIVLTQL